MADERRIAWDWSGAARGALSAFPGGALVLVDVTAGIVVALGALVVAMLGVPPIRKQRPRLGLVGAAFAAAYALGSVLGLWEPVAIAGLVVLAYLGVLAGVRKPAARLLPAILLPALALGMNHPAPGGLVAASIMLAGAAWATVVTYAWPESQPPTVNATAADAAPEQPRASRAVHAYAFLYAAAAGIGLALGYLLDLTHVAWSAAAAMFIMRPEPGLLASRAAGRVLATFAGVIAAGLVIRRGPAEIVVAVVVVTAIAAMVAVRTSRWYVAPAGSALIVLLLSGATSRSAFDISFSERVVETAIGAALALTFGIGIPSLVQAVGDRDRLEP